VAKGQAMKLARRRFLHLTAGAAASPAISRIARAQTFPSRPITIVVGYAAGGPTDTIARIMAERMKTVLGQPVLVEYTTGAGGSIAVGRVIRAAPDGYTVSMGDMGNYIANQALYPLQYNLRTELQPVAMVTNPPSIVFSRKGMSAADLKDLIAWLRANPNKGFAGTGGVGSGDHLAGLIFANITGTRIQFVPYRGEAPAIQDLVSGQIDLVFASPLLPLPQVRAGLIKAYAVMGPDRLDVAPELPTVDEAGAPGAYYTNWLALFAPKNTPKELIARINAAVTIALADTTVQARFADLGTNIPPRNHQTPEWLAGFHKEEFDRWWPILQELR
jgi:tripartite-type tricarboxylate transporter receptor subunit TctC